jgi:phenylacetate-CoA ligase
MRRTLKEWLHGHLYLNLQSLRGRDVARCMRVGRRWDSLDRESYARLSGDRLRAALRRAHASVPFYARGAWAQALDPANVTELSAWPILERDVIVSRGEELQARSLPRGTFYRRSSASSGPPIRVALDPHGAGWSWASEYRAMAWHGLMPGVRTLTFMVPQSPLQDRIRNRVNFPVGDLSEAALDAAARRLLTDRPRLIWGLPSAVFRLARYIRSEYPDAPSALVPYARLGGEQIYAFQRDQVVKHLGARVIESYGSTEVGAIASECTAGAMHVFSDHVHLEVMVDGRPAAPGEMGDLVLTSLTNRAMPLVRCRVGDRGRVSTEPCECGLPLPVLRDLQGRMTDVFEASDGRKVHGAELGEHLSEVVDRAPVRFARQILFQQHDADNWTVFVEAREEMDETIRDELAELIRRLFGPHVRVRTESVPAIPREASGKFRYYGTAAMARD